MVGTFSFVARGARPLALILLALALLLHGDAASTHRGLQEDAEAPELPWATATADAKDDELLLHGTPWANETDPWEAVYEHARWWLSLWCPRREKNGALPRITKLCYARELRSLEKFRPPPPQESPEEEARRRVIEILTTSTLEVYPWPDTIRNPVIKARYPTYRSSPASPV
ncbi:unnamed protein product [Urochloa humidicola]